MRALLGVIAGLVCMVAGLAIVALGAFAIHPGLGWLLIGSIVASVGAAIAGASSWMSELNADWRKWPRFQQCALYVVGMLEELRAQGWVSGGHELTAASRPVFTEMKAAGFEISPEEQTRVVRALLADTGTQ